MNFCDIQEKVKSGVEGSKGEIGERWYEQNGSARK